MVFREEEIKEGGFMCYIDEIRDMCIFVLKGEVFCVMVNFFFGFK